MLEIFAWYMIFNVAFLLTSLITLHFPAWRMAKDWAADNLEPEFYPTNSLIAGHTIVYVFMALLIFPALALSVIFFNKDAVRGYTKSLIKMIMKIAGDEDA